MSIAESINLNNLTSLSEEANSWLINFLSDKPKSKASSYEDRALLLTRAKKNPEKALRIILNNYGFRTNFRFRKPMVIEVDLPPILQKLTIANGDVKFDSGSFRDANWVKTGCLGETAFLFFINCMFDFFNLETKLPLINQDFAKNLLYGGDGGFDFQIGLSTIDIKYRDDNPAKGLALQNKFLKSAMRDAETLLVQVSNTVNDRKLGHSVVNTPFEKIDKYLPLALVGYITVDGFDKNKVAFENGFSDWIVDDLWPISDLILRLIEEVNDIEGMFEI